MLEPFPLPSRYPGLSKDDREEVDGDVSPMWVGNGEHEAPLLHELVALQRFPGWHQPALRIRIFAVPSGGMSSPFDTRMRTHSSTTSWSDFRQVSRVEPVAITPRRPRTSAPYEPSSSCVYRALDVGLLDEPVGSTSLADLVERRSPRAHVHGHVHHQFGRTGRHFNVASGGLKRAMLINLETMEHEVVTG